MRRAPCALAMAAMLLGACSEWRDMGVDPNIQTRAATLRPELLGGSPTPP